LGGGGGLVFNKNPYNPWIIQPGEILLA
jgi:hypothetical protein